MKIVSGQFNDSYFPIMDGVGMTTHNYAYWLNRKYGTGLAIAPKVKGYQDHVDYRVVRFKSVILPGMNPYRIGLPQLDIRFKKKIKKIGFDIVHAHCPFISGQLALKISKKLGIPLITTFHTKYREDFMKVMNNEHFIDFLMKFTLDFYKSADQIWVPNKATGKTLEEYGFKGNYEVVRNGTDLSIPIPAKYRWFRNQGLARLNTDSDEFVMLFVGQHRWEKNVRMIIHALKQLQNEGENFLMVFVGEGYASEEMKQLVWEYRLQNQVIFLGVITDRVALQEVFAASDLFLFPSIYDNSPLVLQEAAAFDVPSVVVANTSSAEEIIDGENGFLTDNNPEALANTIRALMSNPGRIRHAGEGARKTIHRPWESIVDEVYLRYKELLRNRNSIHRQWHDEIEEG